MDFMLGQILSHFYTRQKAGFNYHLNYSIDSTNAEVIILGSSRACRHYVPGIIEDTLGMTCFNTGIDGNFVFNNYAIYKSIVSRYTPEIVIMDLNQGDICKEMESYDHLASLLPYYKIHKEIRSIILLKSKLEWVKLGSRIYPYNSSLLAIFDGVMNSEDIRVGKGYIPLYGSLLDTALAPQKKILYQIDPNKVQVLDSIAENCKEKDIRLILLQSPRYCKVEQELSSSLIDSLAVKHNLEFWNYENDTTFLQPYYFKDNSHMNDLGAKEFTKTIVSRVKGIISINNVNHNQVTSD